MTPTYLDANASVPPTKAATDALNQSLAIIGNPSSPHAIGRSARRSLDQARAQVAQALGADEKQVYFNSGASEGNRWLVDAIVLGGQMRGRPYRVAVSDLEHPSMAKPLKVAGDSGEVEIVDLNSDGFPPSRERPAQGFAAIRDDRAPEIIICTAAHNETGIIPDWDAIIASASNDTILIADAAQAMGRLDPLPQRIDAIVTSAHKMGGFPGVGAIVIRGNAKQLPAPWAGGGQESGLRPGTEASHLIAAFGAAAGDIEATREGNRALEPLRDELEKAVLRMYPGAIILSGALGSNDSDGSPPSRGRLGRGEGKPLCRLPNTSAICFNGLDGEALRIALDAAGLCVGFGSACSALAPEPSPSLLSLGLTADQAKATVRFSLSVGFSKVELKQLLPQLEMVVETFRH